MIVESENRPQVELVVDSSKHFTATGNESSNDVGWIDNPGVLDLFDEQSESNLGDISSSFNSKFKDERIKSFTWRGTEYHLQIHETSIGQWEDDFGLRHFRGWDLSNDNTLVSIVTSPSHFQMYFRTEDMREIIIEEWNVNHYNWWGIGGNPTQYVIYDTQSMDSIDDDEEYTQPSDQEMNSGPILNQRLLEYQYSGPQVLQTGQGSVIHTQMKIFRVGIQFDSSTSSNTKLISDLAIVRDIYWNDLTIDIEWVDVGTWSDSTVIGYYNNPCIPNSNSLTGWWDARVQMRSDVGGAWTTSGTPGNFAYVQKWNKGADFDAILYLTDHSHWSGNWGGKLGCADGVSTLSEDYPGFAMVRDHWTGKKRKAIVAHELGHTLTGEHGDATCYYPHWYSFKKKCTLMYQSYLGSKTVLKFYAKEFLSISQDYVDVNSGYHLPFQRIAYDPPGGGGWTDNNGMKLLYAYHYYLWDDLDYRCQQIFYRMEFKMEKVNNIQLYVEQFFWSIRFYDLNTQQIDWSSNYDYWQGYDRAYQYIPIGYIHLWESGFSASKNTQNPRCQTGHNVHEDWTPGHEPANTGTQQAYNLWPCYGYMSPGLRWSCFKTPATFFYITEF